MSFCYEVCYSLFHFPILKEWLFEGSMYQLSVGEMQDSFKPMYRLCSSLSLCEYVETVIVLLDSVYCAREGNLKDHDTADPLYFGMANCSRHM